MLTIFGSTSAGHAKSYYTQGDYYTKGNDSTEHDLINQFGGSLSEQLGIGKEFDRETFDQLLEGKIDDSTHIGKKVGDQIIHRPGWDLTFSAPKSVSIMALIEGGDPRLIQAHREAVETAMKHVEENLAFVRRTVNDKNVLQKVDSLAYATFEHGTSRLLDPQLHSHNFVFNMALDEGKFRSLETKPMFDNMLKVGAIYRNELAAKAKRLGHEITYDKDGLFELANVPESLIKDFSKRRDEIEQVALEMDLHGGKQMQRAALLTRESKIHATAETCQKLWKEECELHNFNPKQKVPPKELALNQARNELIESAKKHLMISIDHFSQFEAAFSQTDVIDFTVKHALGSHTLEEYHQGLKELKKDRVIFDSNLTNIKGQDHYIVTAKALDTEIDIIRLCNKGKDALKPIYNDRQIQSHIDLVAKRSKEQGFAHGFTKGQADAFTLSLSTSDRFIAVNGRAGTGKTFMQKEKKIMLEGAGFKVRGMAPTGEAAKKLEAESGIESSTIDSFLHKRETRINNPKARRKESNKPEFWVLDEASLANAKHIHDVMKAADEDNARVLFQGDIDQLGSVEWGKVFKLLIDNGMKSAEMDEIMRQKTKTGKEAVKASIDRDYNKVFNLLHDRTKTDSNVKDLLDDWKRLPLEERDKSLVVIPDIETRDKASREIHDFKAERGEIGHKDHKLHILVNSRMSDAQKSYARFYEVGQVVEFQKDFSRLGVEEGGRYVVVDADKKLDSVHLARLSDVPIHELVNPANLSSYKWKVGGLTWNPNTIAGRAKRGVEVFNVKSREFSLGEEFKWTKTDRRNRNGERGVIADINAHTGDVTLKFQNGSTRVINLNSNDAHTLDYNYVKTAFVSQGLDAKRVFMMSEFHRRNLVNQKSFYVQLSRMKEFVNIYTNQSKEKLINALSSRTGDKESALEHAIGRNKDSLGSSFNRDLSKKKEAHGDLGRGAKAASKHAALVKEANKQKEAQAQRQKVNFRKGFTR